MSGIEANRLLQARVGDTWSRRLGQLRKQIAELHG